MVEEMHTPQTVIRMSKETHALYPDTHFMAYGLAWSLKDYHGKLFVAPGGVIDGMRTEIGMIPEEHLGVVVLANLDGTNFPVAKSSAPGSGIGIAEWPGSCKSSRSKSPAGGW